MSNRPSTAIANRVYHSFSDTEYGKKLGKNIRYERYNLDELSIEERRDLLGPDVNNLEHMRYTTDLAAFYIGNLTEGALTQTEQEDLLIAASIHDQGEYFIGDITHSLKTDENEVEELQKALEHAREMMPDLDELELDRVRRIREEIVFNRDSPLGKRFATIEHMGYLQTALKAYAHFRHNDTLSPETKSGLEWLVADVLMNQFDGKLLHDADDEVLAHFIDNRRKAISEAMRSVTETAFVHYGEGAADKRAKFSRAQQQWDESEFALAAQEIS